MRHRHPLPRIWLMTDERIDDLVAAVARLPRGSGIVFRHYSLARKARRALFEKVRRMAKKHRHLLLLAGSPQQAWAWLADGAHDRSRLKSRGLRSAAVHDGIERMAAVRASADIMFMSPVFATRSHPGKPSLGPVRLGLLAGKCRTRTIALGGMTARRANSLSALRIAGWAAIDALS